jgi:hypothetical protein
MTFFWPTSFGPRELAVDDSVTANLVEEKVAHLNPLQMDPNNTNGQSLDILAMKGCFVGRMA